MAIEIDAEFKALIPQLAADEYELLEASIKAEGCRDALVVWGDILIDGHNRYEICQKHGLPFQTTAREFDSRADVKVWMLRNQLGRRNLSEPTRVKLALQLKPALKEQGEQRKLENLKRGDEKPEKSNLTFREVTRESLAKQVGVSNGKLYQAEYVLKNAPNYIQAQYEGETISANKAYELTKALENASPTVREDSERLQVTDPQLVKLLDEKKSTDTYTEFIASGFIQLTGEDDAIKASDATAWDFQGWLREKSREYSKASVERRQDAKLAAIQNQPEGIYSIIYADPAWEYENSGLYGAADRHYPTMPTSEICDLPKSINLQIADSAVLFLWGTNPLLIDALEVISAWGFQYKTNIVWDKEKPTTGLGFYVRGQHELLLIAVKGDGAWTPKERPTSVLRAPKGEHSAKPDLVYGLIENMYPDQRYIELFARRNAMRPSWAYWGNQSEQGQANAA